MNKDTSKNNAKENEAPTKEMLRANNRSARLANDWAHICKICNRKYTTHSGIANHLIEYHNMSRNALALRGLSIYVK